VLLAISLLLLTGGGTVAENINPGNDGSKYAWAENLGWINAQPGGPGGPGVQVSDSGLTGWMWSENAGWISLSCTNTSCATVVYGVTNDGCGVLAGYAWSENAGWINFAPSTCAGDSTCGVRINPATGIFSGRAWSENAGWITFSSTSPNPYRVATGWRRAAPVGAPGLTVATSGVSDVLLSWTAVSGATSYDIVRGGLSALRSSNGNFQTATQACVADNTPGPSFTASGTPGAGDGYWFLVRGGNCGGAGTYDSAAASQVGSRDAGIAASGNDCP
jgi:hypothetical protein